MPKNNEVSSENVEVGILLVVSFRPSFIQTAHLAVSRLNKKKPGSYLLSHSRAVSSALESLTSVFGMGTGIASPLWPPGIINVVKGASVRIFAETPYRSVFYLAKGSGRFFFEVLYWKQ